jgi:tetratricopeptide (TPR) repeat protein
MQALKDYDYAVSLLPDDVTLLFSRSNVYYRLKDYANALRGYDEVIRRDAKYSEAYLNRGVTHVVLQEYRRAIADFNQAISLDSENGYAFHRRGRAFAKLQQYELAHADFTRALELVPHPVGVYIDIGLLYTKQSEYTKSLVAYKQAISHDPENATAHYNAACAAALLGDVDEACQKLDTAIQLHPPYQEMAATDLDFATIRNLPEFQKRLKPS